MNFLPVSLNISNKRILIVGGGRVGLHKATILRRFAQEDSDVRIVSPQFLPEFQDLAFTLVQKTYEPEDLEGVFMVYVCTENEQLNARIQQEAEARGVLCSVCDNPALCDFISPAIYQDGPLTIAVASNARDVRRSIRVRDAIRNAIEHDTIRTN